MVALVESVNGDLLDRAYYSGNATDANGSSTESFDATQGYDAPSVSGTLSAHDVDNGDTQVWTADETVGSYGTFTIDADSGDWTYVLDDSAADELAEGETATETFSVTVTDSYGATDTTDVTITVTGSNDAPTDIDLSNTNVSVGTSAGSVIGNITVTDVDDDSFTFSITNPDGSVNTDLQVVATDNGYQLQTTGELSHLPSEVTITATDAAGGSYSETFVITLPISLYDQGGDLVASYSTIQAAVDAAEDLSGIPTIEVGEGTYAENVTISDAVKIIGDGDVTIDGGTTGSALTITGGDTSGTLSIEGIDFTSESAYVIYIDDDTSLKEVSLSDGTVSDGLYNGLFLDSATGLGAISLTDMIFTGNATTQSGGAGEGAINFYKYNGDISLNNVTVTEPGDYAENGIQFRGVDSIETMGNVMLNGVSVSGTYEKTGAAFYNYSDVDDLEITDNGLTIDVTAKWHGLNIDGASGTVDLSGDNVSVINRYSSDADDIAIQGLSGDDVFTSGDSDDLLIGGYGDDTLHGGGGDDLIFGADKPGGSQEDDTGNDTLDGDAGDDTIYGGAGSDEIYGGDDNDTLDGGAGDDIINGEQGSDLIYGDDGDDTLFGNQGADTLYGGEGSDTLYGNGQADTLYGDTGTDTIYGGAGTDTLDGGADDDTLYGGTGDDSLYGGDDNDILIGGEGTDLLDGGDGSDTADYSGESEGIYVRLNRGWETDLANKGNWTTLVQGIANGSIEHDDLVSIENITGTDYGDIIVGDGEANIIDGGDGADYLVGGAGDDTILGGEGNDRLYGGADDDTLYGGSDDDSLYGGDDNDTLIGGEGTDLLDGGDGSDTADYSGESKGIYVRLDRGWETDLANKGSWSTLIQGIADGSIEHDDLVSIENITGTDYTDNIVGDGEANIIDGGAGVDYLVGGAGDDTILGGEGNDRLYGGADEDTLDGGEGNDTLVGEDGDDTFVLSEGMDTIYGNGTDTSDSSNVEATEGEADTAVLDGIADDYAISQNDDGSWSITNLASGDVTTAYGIEGIDFSNDGVDLDLTSNVFVLDGDGNLVGSYDTIQDAIDADSTVDGYTVEVHAGTYTESLTISKALTLVGDGDVTIDGGTTGSALTITGGDTSGTLSIEGIDFTSESAYVIYIDDDTSLKEVSLSDGTVSDGLYNGLFLDSATGLGAISLTDMIFTGNATTQSGGAGEGAINFYKYNGDISLNNVTVTEPGDYAENGIQFRGVDSIETMGNVTLNGVSVSGTYEKTGVAFYNFADALGLLIVGYGLTINVEAEWHGLNIDSIDGTLDLSADNISVINTYEGGSYDDIAMQGLSGSADFTASDSDDLLIGGYGDDILHGGDGDDLIFGADKPGGSQEADTSNDTLYGDAGDDILYGGDGSDTLYGGADDDILYGGDGDDVIDGGDGDDIINGEQGSDLIYGGAGDDILFGNQGADTLYGGEGSDTLYGNGQADTLYGDTGTDTLYGGAGTDTLDGGAGDDTLYGGTGDDGLYGGDDNDTLVGGDGSDLLDGGAGSDTADYSSESAGVYVRLDYGWETDIANMLTSSLTDGINNGSIEHDDLVSIENITGTDYDDIIVGDGEANIIDGGDGADFLFGEAGNDILYGGSGIDNIFGETGDDTLYGGSGNDSIFGGTGDDVFVMDSVSMDTIMDYTFETDGEQDSLDISNLIADAFNSDGNDDVDSFVSIDENGIVTVDVDGAGAGTEAYTVAHVWGASSGDVVNIILDDDGGSIVSGLITVPHA